MTTILTSPKGFTRALAHYPSAGLLNLLNVAEQHLNAENRLCARLCRFRSTAEKELCLGTLLVRSAQQPIHPLKRKYLPVHHRYTLIAIQCVQTWYSPYLLKLPVLIQLYAQCIPIPSVTLLCRPIYLPTTLEEIPRISCDALSEDISLRLVQGFKFKVQRISILNAMKLL